MGADTVGGRARPYSRWALVVLVGLASVSYLWLNKPSLPAHVVKGDGEGYYAYLTAYIVDRDPSFRSLVARRFQTDDHVRLAGLTYQPATGRYLNKYPAGEALLALPLFGAGHAVALWRGEDADGYSRSEQLLAGATATLWGALGLAALRRVLLRRFSEAVTALTLVCITLGTSLVHYIAYDASYSHALSFGAVCVALLAVTRWLDSPGSRRRALELGLAAGLVVSLRPANIVVVVPLLLLGVIDRNTLRARAGLLRRHRAEVLIAAAAAAPPVLVVLLAWRLAAGHWLLFSYPDGEQFAFGDPQWRVLYSFEPHGLLPYAPVLVLAAVGMVPLRRRAPEWFWPVAIASLVATYLFASWRAWHLGDGFGHRGFVDVLGLFAIPMAALFGAAWNLRRRWSAMAAASALTLSTMLGTLAYWQDRLPPDGAAPGQYVGAIVGGEAR